ncbi:hypothetical protein U1Q18_034555 [Sarracenia purpurea var. burkii]
MGNLHATFYSFGSFGNGTIFLSPMGNLHATNLTPVRTSFYNCCFNGLLPACRMSEASKRDEKEYNIQDEGLGDLLTWDDALLKGTQQFQHRSYNLFTCNCHSFVANLNRLGFESGGWNVMNLAALIFLKGGWVNKASMLQSYLPFVLAGFFLVLTVSEFDPVVAFPILGS